MRFFLTFVCVCLCVTYAVLYSLDLSHPQTFDRLYFYSGWVGFAFLLLSLVVKWKKYFGLLGFFASFVHLWIFIVLDFDLQIEFIIMDLKEKTYLLYGFVSFALLTLCALGSIAKNFYLSLLVYLSIVLALLHIVFIQKVLSLAYIAAIIVTSVLIAYKFWNKVRCKLNKSI
ncbi:hypothetical protein [Helicobacter cinaedi]|uniref:hypothetical protein n=1 Tax=Helicobacter cinaedi TaxID=213 RepID=UPI000CF181B0|nr:hypothetical protein [Helicobacter cinaedi]